MPQKNLEDLYDFIHEAQKERGTVALYLQSDGNTFSEELESQFLIVDQCIQRLPEPFQEDNEKLQVFFNAARYLPAKRKYVVAKMLSAREAISFYSRELIAPAIEITEEFSVFTLTNHPNQVAAFVNFLRWKERVGLERALGIHFLKQSWKNLGELKERLQYILSEQQAYERMFLALADLHSKNSITELQQKNPDFQRIEQIHQKLLQERSSTALPSITAIEWFQLFTAKMDLLYQVGKSILARLGEAHTADLKQPHTEDPLQSSKTIPLENTLQTHLPEIQKLLLLDGLAPTTLQDILKHARVVTHQKGTMILMQGEQASRFYIILDGWVKLFKGNVDGEESVLQILHRGDNLLESVIFSDVPLPVNAQAVDAVTLLSIPASWLREKLKQDHQLAINLLATTSHRSQALISQFEQLTLKTVAQRVGWFLLKLFLENGENTKDLKLPYDKSLIAGYLGMKPETFSRTLQTLKEQGIDIEKNLISLPNILSLCSFCDHELATRCSRHNTPQCPNPGCSH